MTGNVKIINSSPKFVIKVATQKSQFNLCKNRIHTANLKKLSNQSFDSASKLSSSKFFLPLT